MLICEQENTQSESANFSMFQFTPDGYYRQIIKNLSIERLKKLVVKIQRRKKKDKDDDDDEDKNEDDEENL